MRAMWRRNTIPYGILVVAGVSVTLQIVGFSSLGWLTAEILNQESHISPSRGKLIGMSDTVVDKVSKPDRITDQDRVSFTGKEVGNSRSVQRLDKESSSEPPKGDNNEQSVESKDISAPEKGSNAGKEQPVFKEGVAIPGNKGRMLPSGKMGVASPENGGNRIIDDTEHLWLPSKNGNGKPSDKMDAASSENGGNRTPNSNAGRWVLANNGNNKQGDKMGAASPENDVNRNPNDNVRPLSPANNGNGKQGDKMGAASPENDGNRNPNDNVRPWFPKNNGNRNPNDKMENGGKRNSTDNVRPVLPAHNDKMGAAPTENGGNARRILPTNELKRNDLSGDQGEVKARKSLPFTTGDHQGGTDTATRTVINVGLWTAKRCSRDTQAEYCLTVDAEMGINIILLWSPKLVWHGKA